MKFDKKALYAALLAWEQESRRDPQREATRRYWDARPAEEVAQKGVEILLEKLAQQ